MCKNGHYWTEDAILLSYVDDEDYPKCPICNEKHVWSNLVNTTNGSFEKDGTRIDGYVDLELDESKCEKCSECGTYLKKVYKIPK